MNMHTTIPPAAMRRARLSKMFAAFERDDVEEAVDMLIDMLDAQDGDPDLEDDDPRGDPLDFGEAPTENGAEMYAMLPRYGVDQRRGPINEREAYRAWHAEMMR